MNAKEIRRYWLNKCKENNLEYKTNKYIVELVLLKRLLEKYGEHVVLESIDKFFEGTAKPLSILFFASQKVFPNKFSDIIHNTTIIKYKRSLPSISADKQTYARELISEYLQYTKSFNLSDLEKERKIEIIEELESIC